MPNKVSNMICVSIYIYIYLFIYLIIILMSEDSFASHLCQKSQPPMLSSLSICYVSSASTPFPYFPILFFFHCFCHCDLGYDVKYYKLVCWCRCWSIWIGLSEAKNKNKNKRKKRRTIVCGKKKKNQKTLKNYT